MEENENQTNSQNLHNLQEQQNLSGHEGAQEPQNSVNNDNVERFEETQKTETAEKTEEVDTARHVGDAENVDHVENEKIQSNNTENADLKAQQKGLEKKEKQKNLSADEIYAQAETEKLLKKKKTKRLVTLAGLAVAFCLAIVVIVLAVVPVSLSPKCLRGGFDKVVYYAGTSNSSRVQAYDKGTAGYNQVMNAYKKSFGQAYLSALFSGSLSSYDINETVNGTRTSYTGEKQVLGLLDSGDYCLYLRFNENQTLTKQNGKVYSSRYSGGTSAWPDGKIVFNEAFVEVNKAGGFSNTRIFVVGQYPVIENRQPTGDFNSYIVTITVRADTSVLYGIWDSLKTI